MVNAQISYEKYSMANGHWPIGYAALFIELKARNLNNFDLVSTSDRLIASKKRKKVWARWGGFALYTEKVFKYLSMRFLSTFMAGNAGLFSLENRFER